MRRGRNSGSPWFFGIEKADRSAGIRVISSSPVEAGGKYTVSGGVTTTSDGERVISGAATRVGTDVFAIPDPVYMNNKATGGGTFGAQTAIVTYTPPVPMATETFSYPDGPLVGNNGWMGSADAYHSAVVNGNLRVYWSTPADAYHAVLYDDSKSSFKVTFKAKAGAPGSGETGII